mgnify:CR=1 FL=1
MRGVATRYGLWGLVLILAIAFLLLGGNKGGEEKSWYRKNVPVAEKIYKAHLETLRKEANDHGPEI